MPDHVPEVERGQGPHVLEQRVESFAARLESVGYCAMVVCQKRATAAAFGRWAVRRRLDVATIDEAAVEAFLKHAVRRRIPIGNRRCTLTAFLEYLRAEGTTVRPEPVRDHSHAALLLRRYAAHLHVERGLAEDTVNNYLRIVSPLARTQFAATGTPAPGLEAQDVRDFLLARARPVTPRTAQHDTTALRSFLRFLFLRGETTVDLSLAVPAVRRWRLAAVHPYLHPVEVERLLDACDRTTACGRRDHAILLLLARLGMRACEVAALEIGDLRWRSGEIVVRGKGRVHGRLPLLPDVGAAVALHLRGARPQSPCRRVFLRNDAPRVGLGPDGVGFVVRRALARAGLHPPGRGSHLLRYSLATTMIRHGASMAEIGEVLRHRSTETTEIYAKVDFEALRTVALPWTGAAGGAL